MCDPYVKDFYKVLTDLEEHLDKVESGEGSVDELRELFNAVDYESGLLVSEYEKKSGELDRLQETIAQIERLI